jgi:putative DNA primase/helicase
VSAAVTRAAMFGEEKRSIISGIDRLTEAGAAERFARRYGDELRYDHRRGRWLRWEHHRFVPDSDAGLTRLAIEFARCWQHDAVATMADPDRREATIKFALRLERRDGMSNMLQLARALKPIADAGDGWDADPWLLGVSNGVVDLRDGTLRDGRPEDRITMTTGTAYDPAAECPRWEQFINEIFAPHVELVGFMQRAAGYSLTGITSEQALFLLYGTGSNGKGTYSNTLKRVLGDYAFNMPFATLESRDRAAIPNDLAALVGRRFVIASETNDGTRLNEARVKALTGSDPVTARFLHSEFFTFEPVAKFWLSVNHKPIVRDDSHGFWRRIRLVPFLRTFTIDKTLGPALDTELTGILAWVVRGALLWQRDGLSAPAVVADATREYATESDVLADFLSDACHVDPAAEVAAATLYRHYLDWSLKHGLSDREKLTSTMFGRKVSERFQKARKARGNVYLGVTTTAYV